MIKPGDFLIWFNWYPVRYWVRLLSRRNVVRFGKALGLFNFWIRGRKRQVVVNELAKTLNVEPTQTDLHDLARSSFQQACTTAMETFCFPRFRPDNINHWMRIQGADYINQALARECGIVVVIAHYGANQMVMAGLGHRGYIINQIGSRPDDWHRLSGLKPSKIEKSMFRIRLNLEKALPARYIYIDKSMRPVYEALSHNQIMIMAADGRAGTRFYQIPVCGRVMNISSGPFRIAAKTGAALIPVFPVRDNDGIHDLYIDQPIQPDSQHSFPDAWARKAALIYGERMTHWVNFRPDHYAMLMAEAATRSSIDAVPLFEDYRHV
jgi:phosphatidylinositol dimannoside acyltransferase